MDPAGIVEKAMVDEVLDNGRSDSLGLIKEEAPTDDSVLPLEMSRVNEWQELMGKDLLLKSLHPSLSSASDEKDNDIVHVQPQDTVLVDFTGYYCDDTTKSVLFPSPTDESTSSKLAVDGVECAQRYFQEHNVPIVHRAQDVWCVVGDKDVIPALEMGIRFMHLNETALIYSHSKYAYSLAQRTYQYTSSVPRPISETIVNGISEVVSISFTLPAEANVVYIVTLKQIASSDAVNQPSFQLKLCQSKKVMANDIYQCDLNDNMQSNQYAKHRAIHIYQRTADMLESVLIDGGLSETEISEATNCRIDCLNNIVAVHMKCQLYHAAKEACVQVLKVDPHNIKALLRAAKAALYDPASSYEEVKASIQAVEDEIQQSSSNNDATIGKDLEKLRREFQSHQRKYQRQQREMYSRMANQIVKETTKDSADTNVGAAGKTQESSNGRRPSWIAYARLRSTLNELPWMTLILPYGVQVLLFFGMLFYLYLSTHVQQIDGKQETNAEL